MGPLRPTKVSVMDFDADDRAELFLSPGSWIGGGEPGLRENGALNSQHVAIFD